MHWTQEQLREWETRNQAVPVKPTLPILKKSRMNKWEQAYAEELDIQKRAGLIEWFGFEAIRLRLAKGAFFTPDFAVVDTQGLLSFTEVKGHWREAALVRIKVAGEQFPFPFIAIRRRKVKDGGGWDIVGTF